MQSTVFRQFGIITLLFGLGAAGLWQKTYWLTWVFWPLTAGYAVAYWLTSDFLKSKRPPMHPGVSDTKPNRRYQLWRLGGTLLIIALFAAGIAWAISYKKKHELLALKGALFPASEPTPSNPCGNPAPGTYLLLMGINGYITDTLPRTVIRYHGDKVVELNKEEDGAISLSLDVRDRSDKVVMRVDKNQFVVSENNKLEMKRADKSTISVTDEYGDQKFTIQYLNRTTFRMMGYLRHKGQKLDFIDKTLHGVCIGNAAGAFIGIGSPPSPPFK